MYVGMYAIFMLAVHRYRYMCVCEPDDPASRQPVSANTVNHMESGTSNWASILQEGSACCRTLSAKISAYKALPSFSTA